MNALYWQDSSHGLHIGPDDIRHSTNLSITPDFITGGLTLLDTIRDRFNCDIDPNFVAVFETVRYGLGGIVDS